MKTKKEYTAPELTTVTIKSERGYAGSVNMALFTALIAGGSDTYQMEDYETANGWDQNTDAFWN